ncbi:MAG: DUF4837 family protein, partial [Flavobacteriales bacterium]
LVDDSLIKEDNVINLKSLKVFAGTGEPQKADMKLEVFGEIKDSYMSTETRFPDVFPLMDTISVSGQFGLRTRGWWKMENDFLGGYFIRYTLVDERRAKVVHVETALYCPKYDKMFYLRTLESVLNGIEFSTLN